MYRSTRVWNLYLDLEESLGTVETAKAAYERALEVRAFLLTIFRTQEIVYYPLTPGVALTVQKKKDSTTVIARVKCCLQNGGCSFKLLILIVPTPNIITYFE